MNTTEHKIICLHLDSDTVRYMYDNHRDCFDDYARRIRSSGRNMLRGPQTYDLWANIYA